MKGNIDPAQLLVTRLVLGQWLADLREGKGWSQTKLAAIMGVEQATVSKVEQGKWAISIDMLTLFCHHLEYPLENIFKNE